MRKLSSWATRLALSAGATAGIVAACYNEVPGPSGPLPLPPTREVQPQGPRPGPITPTPITPAPTPITPTPNTPVPSAPLDAGPGSTSRVIETNVRFAGAQGEDEDIDDDEDDDALDAGIDAGDGGAGDGGSIDAAVTDAGVADVIDLPPLPDSDVPLEPPGLEH